jgi:hypothetical protein
MDKPPASLKMGQLAKKGGEEKCMDSRSLANIRNSEEVAIFSPIISDAMLKVG